MMAKKTFLGRMLPILSNYAIIFKHIDREGVTSKWGYTAKRILIYGVKLSNYLTIFVSKTPQASQNLPLKFWVQQ